MLISKEDTLKLIRDSVNLDEAYIAVKNMDPAMENEYMMHHINGMCLFRVDGKRCRFPAVDVRYIDHFGVNEDEVLMFSTSGAADWYGEIGVQLTDEVKNFFRAMFHKEDRDTKCRDYRDEALRVYLSGKKNQCLSQLDLEALWSVITIMYGQEVVDRRIEMAALAAGGTRYLINLFTEPVGYTIVQNCLPGEDIMPYQVKKNKNRKKKD